MNEFQRTLAKWGFKPIGHDGRISSEAPVGYSDMNEFQEVRIHCPLGDECKHSGVDECDAYRQMLLEEEHKKTCGENCPHFRNPSKGIPTQARYQGLSPAEFLLWSRGK